MYSICCNSGFNDKQENVVNFEEYLKEFWLVEFKKTCD